MKAYYSIARICGSIAGLKALIYTDMTNVANYGPGYLPLVAGDAPSFTDVNKVYSIAYEQYAGLITRRSVNDAGGDWHQTLVSAYVPRGRQEVDVLLKRWRNRTLMIIAIDRYDNQHLLFDARASFDYTSGDRPGTRHGYTMSFTAASHYILDSIAGNGEIETAPPIGGGGGGGGSSEGGCCITFNPLGIDYTPAPSGNVNNHNQIVYTDWGGLYFIDDDGRGVILNAPPPMYHEVNLDNLMISEYTLPSWFYLPDPDDYPGPTYSETREVNIRLYVLYGSRWLAYEHGEGYTIDYANHKVVFGEQLDGGILRFYSYPGLRSTPL